MIITKPINPLSNDEESREITLPYVVVDEVSTNELSHKKRALAGNVFVNYYGVDEEFQIKSRLKAAEYHKLKYFMGNLVSIRNCEDLDDGEYFMEKMKVKEFSINGKWYHLEFSLKKYFTRDNGSN